MSVMKMNIRQLAQALSQKQLSSVALTKAYLAQIEKVEPAIHAYIQVTEAVDLAAAEASDHRR